MKKNMIFSFGAICILLLITISSVTTIGKTTSTSQTEIINSENNDSLNGPVNPSDFVYDSIIFSGKISDFKKDGESVSFFAIDVNFVNYVYGVISIQIGETFIPIPFFGKRTSNRIQNEYLELKKADYDKFNVFSIFSSVIGVMSRTHYSP